MSQATLKALKVEIKKVEDSLPRLRQLIVGFEKRLTDVTKNLPPFVTADDPRFQRPLQDLTSCQQLLNDVQQSMKKHVVKLAKFKNAAQVAEKTLAEL